MTYDFPPDVAQLVRKRMQSGHYHSEDDVLRDALHALDENDEDFALFEKVLAELETDTPPDHNRMVPTGRRRTKGR